MKLTLKVRSTRFHKKKYHAGADKNYKHGLRKHSKYFVHEAGRLYFVGCQRKSASPTEKRLVVLDEVERKIIISSIHDGVHLGRDKTLVQINSRYYWPDMYKQICSYVRSSCYMSYIINNYSTCNFSIFSDQFL